MRGQIEWSETIEAPEWTEDDIASALEWQREQDAKCACGHPIDETSNDGDRAAWIAEPVVCWACAARDRAEKAGGPVPGRRFRTRNRANERG